MIFIFLFQIISGNSFADGAGNAQIQSCSTVALASPAGTVCETTNNSTWTRENYGWRDSKGKLWQDYILSSVNLSESTAFCRKLPSYATTLPTKEALATAFKHQIGQVFKDMDGSTWFRTSSRKDAATSYVSNGNPTENDRTAYDSDLFNIYSLYYARCVSP